MNKATFFMGLKIAILTIVFMAMPLFLWKFINFEIALMFGIGNITATLVIIREMMGELLNKIK